MMNEEGNWWTESSSSNFLHRVDSNILETFHAVSVVTLMMNRLCNGTIKNFIRFLVLLAIDYTYTTHNVHYLNIKLRNRV